jgi:non-specific serine/threonine protein kinase
LSRQEGSPAAVQAWIAEQLAHLDALTADHDNFRAAIDWAVVSGRRDIELGLVGILWSYWWYRGYVREGMQRLDSALRRAGAAAEPALVHALHVSLVPLLIGGHYDQALRNVVRAYDLAALMGDDVRARRLQTLRCSIEWATGNEARAVELLGTAIRDARAAGDEWVLAQALNVLGMILSLSGDIDRGLQLLDESLQLVRQVGDWFAEPYALVALAKLWLDRGDLEKAEGNAQDGCEGFARTGDPWGLATALVMVAGVALRQRNAERAARLLGAAEALLDDMNGLLYPAWQTDQRRFTAEARAALGDADFAAAVAEGRAIPLDNVARAVADLLAGVGEAAPSPPDMQATGASPSKLTPREAEIARLIAAGQSNREIAATLVLSVRTVERHIENIYTKLGVHGQAARAAVATYAARAGLLPGDAR